MGGIREEAAVEAVVEVVDYGRSAKGRYRDRPFLFSYI